MATDWKRIQFEPSMVNSVGRPSHRCTKITCIPSGYVKIAMEHTQLLCIPSGYVTIEIVDIPIRHGDFPVRYVTLTEGNHQTEFWLVVWNMFYFFIYWE